MPKVTIRTPVKVDGEIHRPGDADLPEKAIKALEASGAVTRYDSVVVKINTDDLVAAIGNLSHDQFDGNGKPKLDALATALGVDKVTAKARDLAWKQFQGSQQS